MVFLPVMPSFFREIKVSLGRAPMTTGIGYASLLAMLLNNPYDVVVTLDPLHPPSYAEPQHIP